METGPQTGPPPRLTASEHDSAAALALAMLGIASGCATTGTQPEDSDPLESANRTVYGFNDALDDYLLEPIADNYVKYVPQPMRTGVSNFFDNVTYLDVILNDFLQAKGIQGLSDTGRFVVNSTVGFGGIFDPATAWGMSRHDEDFGQTLAVWGTGKAFTWSCRSLARARSAISLAS